MAKLTKSPFALLLGRHKDKEVDNSFQEIKKHLETTHPIVKGRNVGPIDLVVGANYIPLPIPKPEGRLITYQSAASSITDGGVVGGKWLLNATVACTVRIMFF